LRKQREAASGAILAAGGIVRGAGAHAGKILIVRRSRYGGDIGLPKGKVKGTEDLLATALREVKEETGHDVEIEEYAGTTHYHVGKRPKAVTYFVMKLSSDAAPSAVDGGEIASVEWVTPFEARAKLSYPEDRRLIAAVFNLPRE
jgi:8-oxo-dGTP pyrophosphatase MutT (NUDIX family)